MVSASQSLQHRPVQSPPSRRSRRIAALVAVFFAFFAFAMPAVAAIDVNSADQSQLESVKGIGPALSGKILAARKTGAFKDWSDLQTRVSGIGDKNSAGFSRNGLTVAGRAKDGADASTVASRGAARPGSKKGGGDVGPVTVASSAKK